MQKSLFFIFLFQSITFINAQNNFKELNDKAFRLYEQNQTSKAEELGYQLIEIKKNQKPSIYTINGYLLLGIINKNKGYYITSLEHYINALNIAEKLMLTDRISACLNNIGVIYQLQKNYYQALKYFTRSLEIEEKGNNSAQKSIRYFNVGDCYMQLDSLDLALSFFNNSLIIEQKNKSNEGIIFAYIGIAEVYLKLKNLFQANLIFDKIENKITNVQIEEQIMFYKLKGEYFLQEETIESALSFINKAINLSLKNNFNSYILELYLMKIKALEKTNAIKEANDLYKKYIQTSEILANSSIKNKIEDLTYQNELTKKELEIKLVLEERNLAKKNEKFQENLRIHEQKITFFVFLILILFITSIFYGINKLTNFKK